MVAHNITLFWAVIGLLAFSGHGFAQPTQTNQLRVNYQTRLDNITKKDLEIDSAQKQLTVLSQDIQILREKMNGGSLFYEYKIQGKLRRAQTLSDHISLLKRQRGLLQQHLNRARDIYIEGLQHRIQTIRQQLSQTKQPAKNSKQQLYNLLAELEQLTLKQSRNDHQLAISLNNQQALSTTERQEKLNALHDLKNKITRQLTQVKNAYTQVKRHTFLRRELAHFFEEEHFFGEQSFIHAGTSNQRNKTSDTLTQTDTSYTDPNSTTATSSASNTPTTKAVDTEPLPLSQEQPANPTSTTVNSPTSTDATELAVNDNTPSTVETATSDMTAPTIDIRDALPTTDGDTSASDLGPQMPNNMLTSMLTTKTNTVLPDMTSTDIKPVRKEPASPDNESTPIDKQARDRLSTNIASDSTQKSNAHQIKRFHTLDDKINWLKNQISHYQALLDDLEKNIQALEVIPAG